MEKKFSLGILAIKITSRKFWVWFLSSYFIYDIINKNIKYEYSLPLIIIWGIISIIYLIGEPIEKGLGVMFENAKLQAEFKWGKQFNSNEVIETIKKGGKNG